jgi:hypothetical protein
LFLFFSTRLTSLLKVRCSLPANVDDTTLSAVSVLSDPSAPTETTDMSCELVKYRLGIVDNHFNELSSRGKPSYADVLEFDRRYR